MKTSEVYDISPLYYGWVLSNEYPLGPFPESKHVRTGVEQNPEILLS